MTGLSRNDISPNLRELLREITPEAQKALFAAAEHVLGVSNEQVPFEEGTFMRGGAASVADSDLTAAVAYRDTAFPGQAEILHEDLKMSHDPGRNAKFLENVINSERPTVKRIIARSIKDGIKA